MFNFKYALYLIVLCCFFPVNAGSYDDFFEGLKTDDVRVVANVLARGFDPNT